MGLKQIKNQIVSTKKTGKVTKAMESVSAVKMRKSQERAIAGKPYAESAIRILHRISNSLDGKHFFETPSDTAEGHHCCIVITSDKGLAGSLNSAVLKNLEKSFAGEKERMRMIAFGRKAVEFCSREGYMLDKSYTNISDNVELDDMYDLIDFVTSMFDRGAYIKVSIAYQNFVSTFEQNALTRQVLPLEPNVLEVMVRDILPKTGRYSEEEKDLGEHTYTIEPNPEEVLKSLIPKLVQIMVYRAMLESKASEHSARMVAMKNATDKSKEIEKELTLRFNKERQAVITAEVSEITGGIEALKT